MSTTAILLAAGSGSRMQGSVEDKILAPLNGQPVFIHSVLAFLKANIVDEFTLVYRDENQRTHLKAALARVTHPETKLSWVTGGTERQDSVYNALKAQPKSCEKIFIHDCARPLITPEALVALKKTSDQHPAAVLAHPVIDTIKRVPSKESLQQVMLEDLDRSRLWAMETPQVFDYSTILSAYQHVKEHGLKITDDTAAVASIGIASTIVPNVKPNPKITTPDDIAFAEWLCAKGL